ncbi:MAG: hypothetical protein ABR981_03790 [Candidatus Micrarchaeaceae archaeon]
MPIQSSRTTKERNWSIIPSYQGSDIKGYKRFLRGAERIEEISAIMFNNIPPLDHSIKEIVRITKDIMGETQVIYRFDTTGCTLAEVDDNFKYYESSGLDCLMVGMNMNIISPSEKTLVKELVKTDIIVIADPTNFKSLSFYAANLIESWGIRDFVISLDDRSGLDCFNRRSVDLPIFCYVYCREDNNRLITFSNEVESNWHVIVPCNNAGSINTALNKIEQIVCSLETGCDPSGENLEKLANQWHNANN